MNAGDYSSERSTNGDRRTVVPCLQKGTDSDNKKKIHGVLRAYPASD